jgi:hypothetical protein
LFRGYTKFCWVYQTCSQVQLCHCVLRHVSAYGLSSLVAPSPLKNIATFFSDDQDIWRVAYDEEYDGLNSLPTWNLIPEDQFKQLKGVKALPLMVIATIKFDQFNKPKRAKYRIVVLGNLDYHNWSKESTAGP